MIDRRFGARIGLKRELGVSVVVNTSLGAASSGKVKKNHEIRNEKTTEPCISIQLKWYAPNNFKVGDNSNVSPNIHSSVDHTNPHVPLVIYLSSRILNNGFIPPAQGYGSIQTLPII